MLPKVSDDDLASPLRLVTTSWPLGSVECLPRSTRCLHGTQASARLQARRGIRDQKTGTRHRSQVLCPSIYALPWYPRSGKIHTKQRRDSWCFSCRSLSHLLFV